MNQPVAASVTHAYAGPEHGLIYGFVFDREGSAQPLPLEHLSAELALPDLSCWVWAPEVWHAGRRAAHDR